MVPLETVRHLLLAELPDAELTLEDLTGTQDHYSAQVVSAAFAGQPLVARHRIVYRALGAVMDGPVHALALRTYTPEEWAAQRGEG
jgi:stress-induced morphogen